MENTPKKRRDIQLIDCLCKSRIGAQRGTGLIRGTILTIAIGIALFARFGGEMQPQAVHVHDAGCCEVTDITGAA